MDIKLSTSPCELQKLWPTLVHVHIATEVLETLHPGATGLRFIIKIWLVTLKTHWLAIGNMLVAVKELCTSLRSTSSAFGKLLSCRHLFVKYYIALIDVYLVTIWCGFVNPCLFLDM